MKKNVVIILAVVVLSIIIGLSCFFILNNNDEIKDNAEIQDIVDNSNLEVLLNFKNFAPSNFSESSLLEVSMLLADKLGYKSETESGDYIEFVSTADIHKIIKDLTDITIEAPIQIEDFIYRYDSENDYYYFVPLGDNSLYKISNINHVYKSDDIYTIECTANKTIDGETTAENTFITKLKFVENNNYIKYQIISQEIV